MRIQLNAGGLGGLITVAGFNSSLDKLISNSKSVAASFKAVKRMTRTMSGGVGVLDSALQEIDRRITKEEQRITKLNATQKKLGEFIVNTVTTDRKVAVMVAVNKELFYQVNPWARPPVPKKRPWWKKAWDWLCDKGKKVVNTVKKAWNGIKKFYQKHKNAIKKILIGVGITVGLVLLSAATAGTAAGPFVALAVKGAITTGLTSAATSGISAGVQYYKEHGTLKGVLGAAFDGAADGYMSGTIKGAISGPLSKFGPLIYASKANVSAKFALGAQVIASGASESLGGIATNAANYWVENGTLKGASKVVFKDAGKNFLTGAAKEFASQKVSAWKHDKAHSIGDKVKNGTATKFERKLISSKLTKSAFKTAYKSPWSAGRGFAKQTVSAALKEGVVKNVLKDTAKTIGIKTVTTLPKMVFGSSSGMNMPALGAMINNSANNVLSSSGIDKPVLKLTSISMPKFNTALTNVQTFTNLSSKDFNVKIASFDGMFNKSFAV